MIELQDQLTAAYDELNREEHVLVLLNAYGGIKGSHATAEARIKTCNEVIDNLIEQRVCNHSCNKCGLGIFTDLRETE